MAKPREFPKEIIQRYIDGESACSIANDFNTTNSVVISFLKRNKIETRSPNKRKDIDDYIRQEYPKGKSMRQIAKKLDTGHATIRRHIEQMIGIESRGKPTGELHHAYNPHIQFKDRCRKYIELATNWQQQIFERDNWTCWICDKRGGDLNAHHATPFNELISRFVEEYGEDFEKFKETEWIFDTSIGITLCKKCHYELHYGD